VQPLRWIKDFIQEQPAEEYRRLKRICEIAPKDGKLRLEPRVVNFSALPMRRKAFLACVFRGEHPSIAIEPLLGIQEGAELTSAPRVHQRLIDKPPPFRYAWGRTKRMAGEREQSKLCFGEFLLAAA